jgi:integrator complex subunit 1
MISIISSSIFTCVLFGSLRKVLFVEKAEAYYKVDNWPSENDRGLLFRLVSEVPVQEDTLMRVLVMGLTREMHLNPTDSLDMADRLVRRAAALYTEGCIALLNASLPYFCHFADFPVLQVERLELINALLNLCAYKHPENISLPKG